MAEHTGSVLSAIPWFFGFAGLNVAVRTISNLLSVTYRKMDPQTKGYWAASAVSTVHAVVVCVLAALALDSNPSFFGSSASFFLYTEESLRCAYCLLGYILCDLSVSIYYGPAWSGWVANLIHHFAVVFVWVQLVQGCCGQTFVIAGGFIEGTTPFVNARWFLDKFNMKSSPLYLLNGLTMLVLWFLLRIVGFGWVTMQLYWQRTGLLSLHPVQSFSLLLSYAIGYLLQIYWFGKIMKGAYKAAFGKRATSVKKTT